jgi:hypothetical protein
MTLAGWISIVVGFVLYLLAFAQGAGPTMADNTLQASLFTLGSGLLILGFVLVAVI